MLSAPHGLAHRALPHQARVQSVHSASHASRSGFLRALMGGWLSRGRQVPAAASQHTSVGAPAALESGSRPRASGGTSSVQKTHLVLLVHGLFGSRANWSVIKSFLEAHLDARTTLLYVSSANEFAKTFEGIDACGERLVDEITSLVAANPGLERISVVAHSMGGLISRYSLGRLYDPASRTICGLRPCHFVSLATPHLGCDGDTNPAQVPLFSWARAVPVVGGGLEGVLRGAAVPFASLAFRRSGAQFFLMDREGGGGAEPLLARMTRDHPVEGHFYTALAAFETRTAYSNSSGDHLVGWANSSLRSLQQLPRLPGKGRGVVREDPLDTAWHPEARARLAGSAPAAHLHAREGHTVTAGDILRSQSPEQLAGSGQSTGPPPAGAAASSSSGGSAERGGREGGRSAASLPDPWVLPLGTGAAAEQGPAGWEAAARPVQQQQGQQQQLAGPFAAAPAIGEQGAEGVQDSSNGDPSSSPPQVLPLLVPSQPGSSSSSSSNGQLSRRTGAASPQLSAEPAEPEQQQVVQEQQQQPEQHLQQPLPGQQLPAADPPGQPSHPHDSRLRRALQCAASCGTGGEVLGGGAAAEEVSPAHGAAHGRRRSQDTSSPAAGGRGMLGREAGRGGAPAGLQRRARSAPLGAGRGAGQFETEGDGQAHGAVGGLAAALGAATVGEQLGPAAGEGLRTAAAGPQRRASGAGRDALRPGRPRAPRHGPPGSNSRDVALERDRAEYVHLMLERLQRLPWRRVDVCFGRSILPFLAHQHLQVQRRWINFEGIATAKHLALQLAAMEEMRGAEDLDEQRE